MKTLAILPRGGLGDFFYHALFARYVQSRLPDLQPVLIAPRYAGFLADFLGVRHVPACSVLTDASAGLHIRGEIEFFGALNQVRSHCLASFTNDVIDHGLARLFRLSLFDGGALGNWLAPFNRRARPGSRDWLNRLLHYHEGDGRANPKHIVGRQRYALSWTGLSENLPSAYREFWLSAVVPFQGQADSRLVLLFPETAQLTKNLTFEQVNYLVRRLRSDYRLRIFTKHPQLYRDLGVETAGFSDRLDPIRQICGASAVISADTFAAHVAGINATRTYVICNSGRRRPRCEYWGSPYGNVFNFEDGVSYKLDDDFRLFQAREDTPLFKAVLAASEDSGKRGGEVSATRVLTGSAARS
jgi:hypothetical protein